MKPHLGILTIFAIGLLVSITGCVPGRDQHTQRFAAGGATCLEGKQIYFNGEEFDPFTKIAQFQILYDRIVADQDGLTVDPEDHEPIDFTAADPFVLELPSDNWVGYRNGFSKTLYIHSNGSIGMGMEASGNTTLTEYFSSRQISLLPVDASVPGADVRYRVFQDSVVITFQDVGGSTFQCEFFTNGEQALDIAITYTQVSTSTLKGVVGLSRGSYTGEGVSNLIWTHVESALCRNSVSTDTGDV